MQIAAVLEVVPKRKNCLIAFSESQLLLKMQEAKLCGLTSKIDNSLKQHSIIF